MRKYIFLHYKNFMTTKRPPKPKHVTKDGWDNWDNWASEIFPDYNDKTDYVECLSVWDPDSLNIEGHKFYWVYDLCPQGGHYALITPAGCLKQHIERAKAFLRHSFDVVTLKCINLT